MGAGWLTLVKRAAGWLPARWVGESRRHPLRMLCFNLPYLGDQSIKLEIANNRIVKYMVTVIMEINLAPEVLQAPHHGGIIVLAVHAGYYTSS